MTYEGLTYQNNEAVFQAQKEFSPEEKAVFTSLPPKDAKRKGRKVRLRPDWKQVKDGKGYLRYLYELDIILDKKYRKCIDKLNEGLRVYYGMLERAFSPNYSEALDGSVALAMSFGVPSGELLKTISEVDEYFMG